MITRLLSVTANLYNKGFVVKTVQSIQFSKFISSLPVNRFMSEGNETLKGNHNTKQCKKQI